MKKRCYKCKLSLSVSEFSKDKNKKGGLQSWCRQCVAAYNAAYQQTPKGKAVNIAAVARYQQTPKGKTARNAATVRSRAKYPQRNRCRHQLANAITAGKIVRQPCINGCKGKAEGHHLNYSKPFAVIWLCRKCHVAWHSKPLNRYFLNRMSAHHV